MHVALPARRLQVHSPQRHDETMTLRIVRRDTQKACRHPHLRMPAGLFILIRCVSPSVCLQPVEEIEESEEAGHDEPRRRDHSAGFAVLRSGSRAVVSGIRNFRLGWKLAISAVPGAALCPAFRGRICLVHCLAGRAIQFITRRTAAACALSLIHISEPTRP